MSTSIETHKAKWDLLNCDKIDLQLYDSIIKPSTAYTPPQYEFDPIPTSTASLTASDSFTKCTVGIFGPRPYVSTSGFTEQGVVACDLKYASYANHHINKFPSAVGSQRGGLHRTTPQEQEMTAILQDLLASSIQLKLLQKHEIVISIVVHQSSGCQWYDLSFITNAISVGLATSGIALYDMVAASTIYLLPNLNTDLKLNHLEGTEVSMITDTENQTTKTPSAAYTLSIYPPSDVLLNLITQERIPYHPISMTLSYLPSLNQITFSKLQGQLHNNTDAVLAVEQSQRKEASEDSRETKKKSPWELLTHSSLDLCKMVNIQHRETLREFVEARMNQAKADDEIVE